MNQFFNKFFKTNQVNKLDESKVKESLEEFDSKILKVENNQVNKLDESKVKQSLEKFNSYMTIDKILKVEKYLNGYNISLEKIIGCGGLGVVLKGIDNKNQRDIAVKVIINQNERIQKELEEEIKINRNISSPYVTKIYECFYDQENKLFMVVMEYCQNGDLHSFFNQQSDLKYEEIICMFISLLKGIQDIHLLNIIHSNLKPQNILLTNENQLKICDLGIQKVIQLNKSININKRSLIYQPYEQMCNQIILENDYYSIGAVICFLCGLKIEDDLNMAFQLKNGLHPNIESYKNKDIIEIAFQMMSFDPIKRIKPEIAKNQLISLQNKPQQPKPLNHYIIQYKNGDKYEGEFQDGLRNGNGILIYENGQEYIGSFQNDLPNGNGILYHIDGSKYEGNFKNNQRSGQGSYFYANKNVYVGEWLNGHQDGEGTISYYQADTYKGEFKNGLFHGFGHYIYKQSGHQYLGYWKNGKYDGEGKFVKKDGEIVQGIFKEDKLITRLNEVIFPVSINHLIQKIN